MLLEKAREDEFMYPLITCAAMTGMRRSDVCTLRWEDVDLDSGMLSVKTHKTQKGIEIPIFLPLRKVLDAAGEEQSGYVWPEAAKMLKENRGKLTYRFKKIIVQTFSSEELRSNVDDSEIEMQGVAAIKETYPKGPRRDRMISVLRKYLAGDGIRKIEKALGVAKSTVSNDLHKIEALIGIKFMRFDPNASSIKENIARLTRVERKQGQRAASVWDWHALRTTWVTLALAGGVPETTVRIVTGHGTCELVLKHYFKPNREQLRDTLSNMLPEVLTGGKNEKDDTVDEMHILLTKLKNNRATGAGPENYEIKKKGVACVFLP